MAAGDLRNVDACVAGAECEALSARREPKQEATPRRMREARQNGGEHLGKPRSGANPGRGAEPVERGPHRGFDAGSSRL